MQAPRRQQRRAVIGALVIAAAVTAVMARRSADRVHAAGAGVAPVRAGAAAPAAPSLAGGDAAGEVRRYDVELAHTVELGGGSSPTTFVIQVDGAWSLTVVRADATGRLVRGELVASVAVGAGGRPPARDDRLARELARPHYLAIAPGGGVTAFHFAPDEDDTARGIVRSLATATQLIDGDGDRWEADEADAYGRYTAAYTRSGAALEKRKLRYTGARGGAVIDALDTRGAFRVGAALAIDEATVEERIALTAGGVAMSARSRLALRLAGTAIGDPGTASLDGLEQVAVTGGASAARTARVADRELVDGATLADLLAALAQLHADDDPSGVGARLAALLRLEPARAAELATRVRTADDRTAAVAAGALAAAGTAEAQAALAGLAAGAGATTAPSTRVEAAIAAALVEQPGASLAAALATNLGAGDRELRGSSGLALGTIAARLAAADAARAGAIVDELLDRLARTADPEDQLQLLRALGNTGDARALPALRLALASPHPRIRRVAVEALRAIAEPSAGELIAGVLLGDPDASVRRGAVLAASFRPVEPHAAQLARALEADGDAAVRLALVQLLGRHLAVAVAAAAVDRAARLDAAEHVRAEARRLLAGA